MPKDCVGEVPTNLRYRICSPNPVTTTQNETSQTNSDSTTKTTEQPETLLNEPPLIPSQTQIQANLPPECAVVQITDITACDFYLRQKHSTNICLQQGAQNKVECTKIIKDQYQKPSQCANLSETECDRLINQVILADYIEPQKLAAAQEQISSLTNQVIIINPNSNDQNKMSAQTISLSTTDNKETTSKPVEQSELVNSILPINPNQKTSLMVFNSTVDELSQKSRVPAVVMLDQDADGLPDDQEKRFGTNPQNIDTDGDGYSDLVEIKSGYNPLGQGKLELKIEAIDKAIVNQASIGQPHETSALIDQNLKINEVGNVSTDSGSYQITGQAKPHQVITLYIYSQMPLVLTTQTDDNGNWVYQLDNPLNDGKHEVYVAINDDSGNITSQSSPLSFFVKEAKAVTMDQYVAQEQGAVTLPDSTNKMINFYIIGGSALILFAIVSFLFFRKFFY